MRRNVVLMGMLLVSGCATMRAQWSQDVQDRAAFDLQCPREQVKVDTLSNGSPVSGPVFGASGCGRQATYTADTRNGVQMNSPVTSNAPAPAPAAPEAPAQQVGGVTAVTPGPVPVDVDDRNGCINQETLQKELDSVLTGARPAMVMVQSQAAPTGELTLRLRVRGNRNAVVERSLKVNKEECADATRVLARMVAEQAAAWAP